MAQRGYLDPVYWLWAQGGLRFRSVIDLGCADGNFSLVLAELGPARGAALLNVDAQETYRESLAAIHAALGGHFRFCAVGERDDGTVLLQQGAHAYWSSLRDAGDRYWQSLNALHEAQPVAVPMRTLDSLVAETGLEGPFLLKLDIQGGEAAALAGGPGTLARTDAIVIEVMLEDYAGIHRQLEEAGFQLFDLVDMEYTGAGILGWFYAVYLNKRHARIAPVALWEPKDNAVVLDAQVQRRSAVRQSIAESLARLRAGKWRPVPR